MRQKLYYIFIFAFSASFCLSDMAAEAFNIESIGFSIGKSYNSYLANFSQLPGVPVCCAKFESGSGNSLGYGLFTDFNTNSILIPGIRLFVISKNATLYSDESKPVSLNGETVNGIFRHSISTDLMLLQIDPVLRQYFGNIGFYIGPSILLPLSARFEQNETLVYPEDEGAFADSTRQRNHRSGRIEGLAKASVSLTAGFSLKLPMNKEESLFLTPGISYNIGITSILKESKLNINNYYIGLGITYSFANEIKDTALLASRKNKDIPRPVKLSSSFAFIRGGVENSDTSLVVSITPCKVIKYALPVILFDSNSSIIPEKSMAFPGIQSNYSIIDSIVTGKNSGIAGKIVLTAYYSDRGSGQTADARLNAIESEIRRKSKSGNITFEKIKNINTALDNLVEIGYDNTGLNIFEAEDVIERNFSSDTIRFYNIAYTRSRITKWSINFYSNNSLFKSFAAKPPVPEIIDFAATEIIDSSIKNSANLTYTLSVEDSLRRAEVSPVGYIPIEIQNNPKSITRFEIRQLDTKTNRAQTLKQIALIASNIPAGSRLILTGIANNKANAAYLKTIIYESSRIINYPNTVLEEIKIAASKEKLSEAALFQNKLILIIE